MNSFVFQIYNNGLPDGIKQGYMYFEKRCDLIVNKKRLKKHRMTFAKKYVYVDDVGFHLEYGKTFELNIND